jgi:anti-sigma factor RsiW
MSMYVDVCFVCMLDRIRLSDRAESVDFSLIGGRACSVDGRAKWWPMTEARVSVRDSIQKR